MAIYKPKREALEKKQKTKKEASEKINLNEYLISDL